MIPTGDRKDSAPPGADSAREFRQEILVHLRGRSPPTIAGAPRDPDDDDSAVHLVMREISGEVTVGAHLRSTAPRDLLSDRFGELWSRNPQPGDRSVWELSRFAASFRKTGEGRVLSLSEASLQLLAAVMKFARQSAVGQLGLVTSVALERLLIRAGLDLLRVAAPRRVSDGLCVALYILVPAEAEQARAHQ